MSEGVIVVWFSCGAASAVAAKRTIEKYGKLWDIRIVNNPVLEEHEDNRRFLKDVEKWLNYPIEIQYNKEYPNASADEIWRKRRFMAGVQGAPCTTLLKKEARNQWERENEHDYIVLGFTADPSDAKRAKAFELGERDTLIPILVDENITKADCFKIIQDAGIEPPEIYKMGYPNANCIGCVKASSPTYWNLVRKQHPEVFKQRAELSREIGAKLTRVKGKRIFLDELDPKVKGRPLKDIHFECGIFCPPEII